MEYMYSVCEYKDYLEFTEYAQRTEFVEHVEYLQYRESQFCIIPPKIVKSHGDIQN